MFFVGSSQWECDMGSDIAEIGGVTVRHLTVVWDMVGRVVSCVYSRLGSRLSSPEFSEVIRVWEERSSIDLIVHGPPPVKAIADVRLFLDLVRLTSAEVHQLTNAELGAMLHGTGCIQSELFFGDWGRWLTDAKQNVEDCLRVLETTCLHAIDMDDARRR